MTKDETKNIVPKGRLNKAPKMRKRAYARKAEGSRVFRIYQRTWDQIETEEKE